MKTPETRSPEASTHSSNPFLHTRTKNGFFGAEVGNGNQFFAPGIVQPKLKIGQPGDKFEQEADRVADAVAGSPDGLVQRQPLEEEEEMLQTQPEEEEEEMLQAQVEEEEDIQAKPRDTILNRKCEACEKEEKVQKQPDAATGQSQSDTGLGSRLESSRGSGRPLPRQTRAEMESKIGADFSGVNIHTDHKAEVMNRQLHARAFTYGSDIYFNRGEYNPDTSGGKHLLAHELAHVVQQNPERSGKRVQRSVAAGKTNCPASTNNAPADPVSALEDVNDKAVGYARGTSALLSFSAAFLEAGESGAVDAEYERAFGLPPASGGGFMNRLTGQIETTQNEALAGEMELFARRFELVADFLEQPIAYRCDAPLTWGGCNFSACGTTTNAGACTGVGAIKICPNFWNHNEEAQAGILIHEVTHIYWAGATHNLPSNLRLSQCYEELVAQIWGFNARSQTCPTP